MKKKMMIKNDVKKLYHITLGTPTELTPRVPKNRLKEEDGITPRICVCPSIEDCFKGAYWTVGYYEKWKYDGQDRELVRVLEFDIECIGKENIIDSKYIVDNNLVPDAFDTNEFWIINKTVKPSAIYYIYPGAMDYAYLMDHSCIGIELYSYIKIKEGAISEETISKHNGVLYPWELGIQEHQTEKITIDPTL